VKRVLLQIDRLLRGGYTKSEDLRSGGLKIATRDLVVATLALGAGYGLFMGLYAATRPVNPSIAQTLATIVKVPALFLLTLGVTLPSLYVFSALHGSNLALQPTLRLLLGSMVVNLAVLASFGPVTGFFTFSTDSYSFLVLLNVAAFAVAGAVGMGFLRRALDALFIEERPESPPTDPASAKPAPTISGEKFVADASEEAAVESVALAPDGRLGPPLPPVPVPPSYKPYRAPPPTPAERSRRVFRVWIAIFAVVGAQMSWILRPFIGDPNRDFVLFRGRDSNFFEAVGKILGDLFR
jgi:hypothetical protein